jgi:hypothetical protein
MSPLFKVDSKINFKIKDMDIKKILGTDQICVLSSTDLKEFALIEEIKAQEKVDNKMYTADEFAEKHSVSKQTLWRWCKEGILKSMKIGGKVYYKESDLKSL